MALFTGCEYEYIEKPTLPPITTELKFSTDIIPVFNQSCNNAGCHAAGAIPPDLSPANAYSALTRRWLYDTANPSVKYNIYSYAYR